MTETMTVDVPNGVDVGPLHGVHLACQPIEPYRTGCGVVLTAKDRDDISGKDRCVVCWNLRVCDLCGTPLMRTST